MQNRREFLTALSSLPFVGWLFRPVAAAIAPRFLREGETLRFKLISREPVEFWDANNALNSKPWRGFAAGSVILQGWSMRTMLICEEWPCDIPPAIPTTTPGFFIEPSPTIDHFEWHWEFLFKKAPAGIVCIDARTGAKTEIPATEIYSSADFNEFDFGEMVR